MGNTKNKVKVKSLFPIRDKQQVYANLDSFEWNFTDFGIVDLCINSERICMHYIGYSNSNGVPVLTLTSADTKYKNVEDMCKIVRTQIYIERGSDERKT